MRPSTDTLDIGLVNNMPDSALETTERQFSQLLATAAGTLGVRVVFFALPEIERGAAARERIERHYAPLSSLWDARFDALIVTGAEPRAAELPQEPYWQRLVELMEWSAANVSSTVWSCLAAHAAVLHLDGIVRQRRVDKCCGVFEHQVEATHWLTQGLQTPVSIPHSRWNDIDSAALQRRRYEIVVTSPIAGANLFCKEYGRSTFVLWQGHPEYDERSLLKEYQRDIGRYLRREVESYPVMPQGYFDAQSTAALHAFQNRALDAAGGSELLQEFPFELIAERLVCSWRAPAVRLYRNWLQWLAAVKAGNGRRVAS